MFDSANFVLSHMKWLKLMIFKWYCYKQQSQKIFRSFTFSSAKNYFIKNG